MNDMHRVINLCLPGRQNKNTLLILFGLAPSWSHPPPLFPTIYSRDIIFMSYVLFFFFTLKRIIFQCILFSALGVSHMFTWEVGVDPKKKKTKPRKWSGAEITFLYFSARGRCSNTIVFYSLLLCIIL